MTPAVDHRFASLTEPVPMTDTAVRAGHLDDDLVTDADQFLTFTLHGEEYGIAILKVQEIKGLSAITPIPNTPAYLRGVMNLRGTVVPIIDLRMRFAMAASPDDTFTVIVVVNVGERVAGLVVDAVSDVLTLPAADIVEPPELGRSIDISFMTGMAKAADKLILLLDIDRLIGSDVLAAVA